MSPHVISEFYARHEDGPAQLPPAHTDVRTMYGSTWMHTPPDPERESPTPGGGEWRRPLSSWHAPDAYAFGPSNVRRTLQAIECHRCMSHFTAMARGSLTVA